METLVDVCTSADLDEDIPALAEPPPLNADFVKPNKADAVHAHVTRFHNGV